MTKTLALALAAILLASCTPRYTTAPQTDGTTDVSMVVLIHTPSPTYPVGDVPAYDPQMRRAVTDLCPGGFTKEGERMVTSKSPDGWDQDSLVWRVRCTK